MFGLVLFLILSLIIKFTSLKVWTEYVVFFADILRVGHFGHGVAAVDHRLALHRGREDG